MGTNGILVADWGAQGVTGAAGGPLDAPVRVLSDEQRLRVCALFSGGGCGVGACSGFHQLKRPLAAATAPPGPTPDPPL